MTANADPAEDTPKRSMKRPLLLGLLLALLGGAAGFAVIWLEVFSASHEGEELALPAMPPAAFVPLDPIVVNLPASTGLKYLRFVAQLEVVPQYADEVEMNVPRVVDVLNGYLRAVELSDLSESSALIRLRAQMLRRIQVVTGPDRVRDLLVMEFVLN